MTAPRRRAERSDAIANRARLLDGAEAYFAEHGIDASLHGLVQEVGVGIGTLYRHFPSHAALIRALYDRIVDRMDEVDDRCSRCETGWESIETFIDGTTRTLFEKSATADIMQRQHENDADYRPGTKWEAPLRSYVTAAKDEGLLRPDVVGTDVAAIPFLLGALTRYPEPARSTLYARHRAILLDGLRAPTVERSELPTEPATVDEFHVAAHRAARPRTP